MISEREQIVGSLHNRLPSIIARFDGVSRSYQSNRR